ncbi:hypothetical protein ABZ512_06755 [Nocardiopsis dassonvillei]|uniref:hypothetical protein n=1 Tax=Nocardiopsis dassonvillei TaxID=2014 RepID=UPI00340CF4D3
MNTAAVASEWAKIRTVRTSGWSFALFVVVGVVLSAVPGYFAVRGLDGPEEAAASGLDPVAIGHSGIQLALIALVVFSVLSVTSEYATGSIQGSLVAVPRRGVFYTSKILTVTAVVTVLATATVLVAFLATQAAMGDFGVSLGEEGVLRVLASVVLYVVLLCVFSMGLAAVLRSTALTVGILVPMLFMVSTILSAIPHVREVARFLPDLAGQRMFLGGAGDDAALSPLTGGLVLGAWTVAALVAGYWSVVRRDV